jgi:hypothetical protein
MAVDPCDVFLVGIFLLLIGRENSRYKRCGGEFRYEIDGLLVNIQYWHDIKQGDDRGGHNAKH